MPVTVYRNAGSRTRTHNMKSFSSISCTALALSLTQFCLSLSSSLFLSSRWSHSFYAHLSGDDIQFLFICFALFDSWFIPFQYVCASLAVQRWSTDAINLLAKRKRNRSYLSIFINLILIYWLLWRHIQCIAILSVSLS